VDVAVRCALEVGLFGEHKIEEVVIEFVEDVDEDCVRISEHTQRGIKEQQTAAVDVSTPIETCLDVVGCVVDHSVGEIRGALDGGVMLANRKPIKELLEARIPLA
jgi:hypothetical protein